MARRVFRGKVHIGYLAAIVAASNAGGSGSVVGDTTTTMMWIDGVSPLARARGLHRRGRRAGRSSAFRPRCSSSAIRRSSRTRRRRRASTGRAWSSSPSILVAAIVVNVVVNVRFNACSDRFPVHRRGGLGRAARCACRCAGPHWERAARRVRAAAIFLLSLVLAASMMPVQKLPAASWHVALGLGFVSAVFDNIPLTALALKQGGYDWGFLAYRRRLRRLDDLVRLVGRRRAVQPVSGGGSVVAWLRGGWHVALAYVVGFFVDARGPRLASRCAASRASRARCCRDSARQRRTRALSCRSSTTSRACAASSRRSRTIAVVGPSAQWHRPSFFAAKYMQEHGYRIVPVNPRYAEILGERCYPDAARRSRSRSTSSTASAKPRRCPPIAERGDRDRREGAVDAARRPQRRSGARSRAPPASTW